MSKRRHHPSFRDKWLSRSLVFIFIGGCFPSWVEAFEIRVSAASVRYQAYTATGISAELDGGSALLQIESVVTSADVGLQLRDLKFACEHLNFDSERVCDEGAWNSLVSDTANSWQLPFSGRMDDITHTKDAWVLQSSLVSGDLHSRVTANVAAEQVKGTLSWKAQAIGNMPAIPLVPEQLQWVHAGKSSGRLELNWPVSGTASIEYDMAANALAFDSPEGRFAGEDLAIHAAGTVQLDEPLRTQVRGSIDSGALLIDNFYASFADRGLQWGARLSKRGNLLSLSQLHIGDGRALDIKADADFDLNDPLASLSYRVGHFEMHFPEAYQRYMESMAAAWTLDGLTVTGDLLWRGESLPGEPASGVLDVQDVSIVDNKRGRFAVTGLAAHILPGDQGVQSRFSWRGLLLQRINLGAGEAAVKADPGQFSLASPLRLDVLGGRLAIDELHVKLPGGDAAAASEPEIRLYATLDNMDMEQLTKALAWPAFGGTISGKIPGVTLKDGVLAVEGQIEFNVFDGQILLSGLRVERPFGVLPSLAADLEANNLDLQQLTRTFSFGSISGRMSGFVHDLRMLDWKPVAFDAWVGTPEQEAGSHKISRQAVNHLTTIGGGSATTALSGPLLKLFNNFSYKRLGLGCHLLNYTCEVRGLDNDPGSVLIMEGAGVPKIMIRAFNRQMDWPTLVAGLAAASQGESIRVGDK